MLKKKRGMNSRSKVSGIAKGRWNLVFTGITNRRAGMAHRDIPFLLRGKDVLYGNVARVTA